jgi:hypothetical protein
MLSKCTAILGEGESLLPHDDIATIRCATRQLVAAIENNDAMNGLTLTKQLEAIADKFGFLAQISYLRMRFIYRKSDLANKLGNDLVNKLGEAIGKIDIAKQHHNIDEYLQAVRAGEPVFKQIPELEKLLAEDFSDLLTR